MTQVRTLMGPLPRRPPPSIHLTQVRTLAPVSLLTVDRAHFDALMGPRPRNYPLSPLNRACRSAP